ncbi:hypothetical protein ACEPAG_3658 [Sanghuangporus baumii]
MGILLDSPLPPNKVAETVVQALARRLGVTPTAWGCSSTAHSLRTRSRRLSHEQWLSSSIFLMTLCAGTSRVRLYGLVNQSLHFLSTAIRSGNYRGIFESRETIEALLKAVSCRMCRWGLIRSGICESLAQCFTWECHWKLRDGAFYPPSVSYATSQQPQLTGHSPHFSITGANTGDTYQDGHFSGTASQVQRQLSTVKLEDVSGDVRSSRRMQTSGQGLTPLLDPYSQLDQLGS